jgi:hypothetical protein
MRLSTGPCFHGSTLQHKVRIIVRRGTFSRHTPVPPASTAQYGHTHLHAQPGGMVVTRQSNVWPWSRGRCRRRTIRVARQMQCETMCQLRASVSVVLRPSVRLAKPPSSCVPSLFGLLKSFFGGKQRLSKMFLPLSMPATVNQRGAICQVRHNNKSS